MAKENEMYYDTIAELKNKGERLFPGLITLRNHHVCQLLNESPPTVTRKKRQYGFVDGHTTYPKLARALSREPGR